MIAMVIINVVILMIVCNNVSGYKIDPCEGGCIEGLFKQSLSHSEIEIDVGDVGRLIANEIDQDTLLKVLKDTIPESGDINQLWGTPKLEASMVMDKLKPSVARIIEGLVTEQSQSSEQITFGVLDFLLIRVFKGNVNEANKYLDELRKDRLNELTQSITDDLREVTISMISKSSLDTYNVSTDVYRALLKELLPELAQSTGDIEVGKILGYPVIFDELNLIIRKTKNTGSVEELAEKMLTKLVPFIHEGLWKNINKKETPGAAEDAVQQIVEKFGPELEMATKNGLMLAGKLQNVLIKEMEDHTISSNFVESMKAPITTVVDETMTRLKNKGISAKGVINQWKLMRYIMYGVWNKGKDIVNEEEITKAFETILELKKSLPKLLVLTRFTHSLHPMIEKVTEQEVERFRQNNPQLSECGTSAFAATVVGSVKSKIKSLARQYMEGFSSNNDIDEQSAVDYVLQALKNSLLKAIEEQAMDQEDFDPENLMKSDALDDINLQIESSIHSIVMKEMQRKY